MHVANFKSNRRYIQSIIFCLWLVLVITGCVGNIELPVQIPDYSLGPVSSEEFSDLLHDAIPASEGAVHVFGEAQWSGFRDSKNFPVVTRYFRGSAAITDTDILLLNWYEPEKRYKIVKRLPYSEILSVSKVRRAIFLYFDDKEFSVGDNNYVIFGNTTFKTLFAFSSPSGILMGQEKNEAAFSILKDNIKLHESTRPTSDTPIEDDY